MVVSEILTRVDDSVHISFHQVGNDVDILVSCLGWWFRNVNQGNNVFMIEELQQFDFSNDSLGIDQVLECLRYFLDRYFDFRNVIIRRADHTVSAMANLFYVFKLLLYYESSA
jgi:hypothetical protein